MKERSIRRLLDYIYFVQETEEYHMNEEAEELVHDVLDGKVEPDEAVSRILDTYGLTGDDQMTDTEDHLYPGTDVLINLFGLTDQELLDDVETLIVSVRMAELLKTEHEGAFDFEYLCEIHHRLFSDIYPFSGSLRETAVTQKTVFCLPQYIESTAEEIFTRLRQERYLRKQDFDTFVDNLAYFMAEVHALHPFLEGNTRVLRIFFQQLSHRAGWHINPSQTDDARLLEADIAALDGDYQPLISLLHLAVEPLN